MKCSKCQKPFATAPDQLCADCVTTAASENETCRLALRNLSACGYGQTLTQAVSGISELVKAFRESDTELREKVESLEKEKAWLIEKGEKLVRWVESNRHTHEEIRDHNGRLKDTGIWAQFYIAVRGIQRKDTPKPSGQNARAMTPGDTETPLK